MLKKKQNNFDDVRYVVIDTQNRRNVNGTESLWTPARENLLIVAYNRGDSVESIAKVLGISERGVYDRVNRLIRFGSLKRRRLLTAKEQKIVDALPFIVSVYKAGRAPDGGLLTLAALAELTKLSDAAIGYVIRKLHNAGIVDASMIPAASPKNETLDGEIDKFVEAYNAENAAGAVTEATTSSSVTEKPMREKRG